MNRLMSLINFVDVENIQFVVLFFLNKLLIKLHSFDPNLFIWDGHVRKVLSSPSSSLDIDGLVQRCVLM